MHNYLAIDLGAESGRMIVGTLDDERLSITETYRFSNMPVRLTDGLHWDVLHLWEEIKKGIDLSSMKFENKLDSIGVDSWGVDFGLLDANGKLLFDPFHYRDDRTNGMMEQAFKRMPPAELFATTGIQFMQINTLYQLMSMLIQNPVVFDAADKFVTISDLYNYWLTGEITNEFTIATTTQCFNPCHRDWAINILQTMDIPKRLFGPIIEPGTLVGTLTPELAQATGAGEVKVIAPACHDTASAVVAIPTQNQDFAWISTGTWSIMGVEASEPYMDDKALEYNFTNEGGVSGTWRLSKNIMGLWLVQECRREWNSQDEKLSYDEMTRLASDAEPFLSVIDTDFEGFLHPGDMPLRIKQYCKDTSQAVPQTKGQILRVALEGIALKYRVVLERLEELTQKQLSTIYIVGGGTKNKLLNQFAADAMNRTVITGPVEATAIGNILMQAIGLKHIGTLVNARSIVRKSFISEVYEPQNPAGWDDAYTRLRKVIK